jgi:hypothetical protein
VACTARESHLREDDALAAHVVDALTKPLVGRQRVVVLGQRLL